VASVPRDTGVAGDLRAFLTTEHLQQAWKRAGIKSTWGAELRRCRGALEMGSLIGGVPG